MGDVRNIAGGTAQWIDLTREVVEAISLSEQRARFLTVLGQAIRPVIRLLICPTCPGMMGVTVGCSAIDAARQRFICGTCEGPMVEKRRETKRELLARYDALPSRMRVALLADDPPPPFVEIAAGVGLRAGLALAQHRVHASIDEWMMARAREGPDAELHGDTEANRAWARFNLTLRHAKEQARRVVAFERLSKGVPPEGDPK